ncbi:myb-like DNA-binding domain-containing protein [Hirsutella rhossiliensis]|uniref:Myb-like DNA-binding domain-containing protein n=1 Tax=Hirsutella rhossiliensis TaxID=111463 RepID=A0A9P8MU26_9HYPO|nr:myb-like DNA-binding domain-containing protein [Hirsutella rhossiliensis]KAH0961245.1 myb-like DNA-binding domain-containing protein [Hirsutella rhossiliensis]
MPCHRRGPWSNLEDKYLMQLVHAHGPLNWVRIAQTLGSRTAKQCRERYHQNLKPTLDHEPITPEEGLQIERLVHEIGKRWAEIARRLHGRSDNAVKNWWNGSQNRRKRLDRRRAVTHTHAFFDDDRCPRVVPLPMVRPGGLPFPWSAACPRSPAADGHVLHRYVPWGEAPLPSPCSSEPAESDAGSNYTTSPACSSRVLDQTPIELPPLRTWQASRSRGARLPSPSSLAPQNGQPGSQPRPPLAGALGQLPTAPNSPVRSQEQQQQAGSGSEDATRDRDSRMRLATLLG